MIGCSLFHMSCPSCLHTRVDEVVNGAESNTCAIRPN